MPRQSTGADARRDSRTDVAASTRCPGTRGCNNMYTRLYKCSSSAGARLCASATPLLRYSASTKVVEVNVVVLVFPHHVHVMTLEYAYMYMLRPAVCMGLRRCGGRRARAWRARCFVRAAAGVTSPSMRAALRATARCFDEAMDASRSHRQLPDNCP